MRDSAHRLSIMDISEIGRWDERSAGSGEYSNMVGERHSCCCVIRKRYLTRHIDRKELNGETNKRIHLIRNKKGTKVKIYEKIFEVVP